MAITFNPIEVADNMKKYGGFIPGIRPGPADRGVPRLHPHPDHPARARSTSAAIASCRYLLLGLTKQQPVPVRRHGRADHRRRRPRDREADREPADACATTRASCASAALVLVGPPGAGKGTQAQFIAEHFGIPKISTGDIFRANVAEGTPLGRDRPRSTWTRGDLVPDEVTIDMVRDRLREHDAADGFLLDGFPRTVPQAEALDDILRELGTKLDVVLELVVDDDEVVRRLSGRRTCRTLQPRLAPRLRPAADPDGVCDLCGGELFQRDDDTRGDHPAPARGLRTSRPSR